MQATTHTKTHHQRICQSFRLSRSEMESLQDNEKRKSVVLSNGIEISAQDQREYESLTLPNGLQVLLISDPKTEKASAAMDVHVGHQQDPREIPGLAHFLEHMLFLGTTKYPQENHYKQFLASHSGRSNASTSATNTNFYFDILSDFFKDALDIFANFFISPLFTPSATEREMNAVNAEHSKNLQNDMRRLYLLQKTICHPEHDFAKFGTGNLQTLKVVPEQQQIDVRQRLLQFYHENYAANKMKLVLLGKQNVTVLKQWAVELFSPIPENNQSRQALHAETALPPLPPAPPALAPPQVASKPFDERNLPCMLQVVPVKDLRLIELSWPLPSQQAFYESKPSSVLSHLIGHEGKGSILSYLKQEKWANELSAGLFRDFEDWSLFAVRIEATESGMNHVQEIVLVVYEYLSMLCRQLPLDKWIFDETQSIALIDFRFKNKETPIAYTSRLAERMHHYPTSKIVSGSSLLDKYEPDRITEILTTFMVPENMILTVVNKKFEGLTKSVEKWYQTQYTLTSNTEMDPELIAKCKQVKQTTNHLSSKSSCSESSSSSESSKFFIPTPNEFISTDFGIVCGPENASSCSSSSSSSLSTSSASTPAPTILRDDAKCRLWYKPGTTFMKPKMTLCFHFYSPTLSSTPYEAVLTTLFVRFLKDELTEFSYDAELAGMQYSLTFNNHAMELIVTGYHDKLPLLLSKIIETMRNCCSSCGKCDFSSFVNSKRKQFDRIKEKLTKLFENFFLEEPYQHAVYLTNWILETSRWSVDEKIEAIRRVEMEDFVEHLHRLFQQLFIEAFFYGNLQPDRAVQLMTKVLQRFHSAGPVTAQAIDKTEQQDLHGRARSDSMAFTCCPRCFNPKLPPKCLPLMESQLIKPRIVSLANHTEYVYQAKEWNQANCNSAICCLFQLDMETFALSARLQLFAHLAKEPCFNQLRTKEQLGYLVFSGPAKHEGIEAFRIIIQSDVASPMVLESRIENFLVSLRELLDEMDEQLFQKHVNAVVGALLEKPKRESEECYRFWDEIANETYVFERRQTLAAIVQTLLRNDMLEFLDTFIAKHAPKRSKFSIQLFGNAHELLVQPELTALAGNAATSTDAQTCMAATMLLAQQQQQVAIPNRVCITNVHEFKKSMPLFRERPRKLPVAGVAKL